MVTRETEIAGAAHAVLDSRRVRHLDPPEGLFAGMLEGWDGQQASGLLAPGTRSQRADVVHRSVAFIGSWPWQWTPADVEDWTAQLRFLAYLTDQRYGWAARCAFAREELQWFFDFADEQVTPAAHWATRAGGRRPATDPPGPANGNPIVGGAGPGPDWVASTAPAARWQGHCHRERRPQAGP